MFLTKLKSLFSKPVVRELYWYEKLRYTGNLSYQEIRQVSEEIHSIKNPQEYFAACGYPYQHTIHYVSEVYEIIGKKDFYMAAAYMPRLMSESIISHGIKPGDFAIYVSSPKDITNFSTGTDDPDVMHIAFKNEEDYMLFRLAA